MPRTRAFQVTAQGVTTLTGGPTFGDRHLYPWTHLKQFSGRRVGRGEVELFFIQQHSRLRCRLPGSRMSIEAYDRLVDRVRVVVGDRHSRLTLGGLE